MLLVAGMACLALAGRVRAQGEPPSGEDIVRGALLYDKWYAVLGVAPPEGEMPIWGRQGTNTRSGPDTWRCSECHGWDYRGANGAYGSGSHYTGFPDVLTLAAGLPAEEIVAHLKGSKDPAHDFSAHLDEAALAQLAAFLKYGAIDDSRYIDPISLQVIGGDAAHGRELYEATCVSCHGTDGRQIVFRSEGVDESLGAVAVRDPWRFLHRTRFGTAGTAMPVGYNLQWTPEDGRDILAHAQTLPGASELVVSQPVPPGEVIPTQVPGGPASNFWAGLLTALGSFAGALTYAAVFIGGFALLGFIVVTLLRRRR
jgi:thiosulfate dehydrogenase